MPTRSKPKNQVEIKIHQIIDATPILLSFVDKSEKYVFVNKKYEIVFGKNREDIEGKHISEVIGQELYQRSKPLYDRALNGEAIGHEVNIKDSDNKTIRLEVNFVPIWEDDAVIGMVVTGHDITERWARERDQELLANLSTIYSSNFDEQETLNKVLSLLKERLDCSGVWLGEIFTEDASVQITFEDQTGVPLKGAKIELKDYGPELSIAYLNGKVVQVTDIAKDPRTHMNLASFEPLKIESFLTIPLKRKGHLKAIISVAKSHPYTWSKQEVVLTQSVSETLWSNIENSRLLLELKESLRARDEFISICSHELKTPISSLKLMYQMAERELNANDPRLFSESVMRKRIQMSNNQIRRMSMLIEEMLEVARISSGRLSINLSDMDLRESVKNVIGTFQEQLDDLNIKVSLVATEPVIIHADQFRVEQVITNLLTNVMKYGKSLPISIEVFKSGQMGVLKVKDQGIGIDKANLKKIFLRYERAIDAKDVSGLGLGLYITSQIVQAHHGSIHVESELGKGSEFTVEFPIKPSL